MPEGTKDNRSAARSTRGYFANKRMVAPESVIACDLEDRVVLLNPEDGIYYNLETVAYRIWTLVQEPVGIEEIEEAILREYDVSPEVCRRDVVRLLAQLKDRNLLEVK